MTGLTRALLITLILCGCWPTAVLAQSDSGVVRAMVLDAKTNAPISAARVVLDGPVSALALTDRKGIAEFSDVDGGIYNARVLKQGYATQTSPQFEVLVNRIVTVRFLLSTDEVLKVIGTVRARATTVSSTTAVSPNSAQRRLSDDLAGALNKLSGVSVSTNGSDSDATQTISLEGHDASQTQLTLDGIPVNAPGSAGNIGMFASDLFSGASVSFGPSIGGLGGSVNFTTLQPTLSWLTQATLSTGSYGRYNYSLAETGSIGRFGLAVQTVYRLNPSLVDGDRYLDASGQNYVHEGDSSYGGDLVKLRYQFSDSQTVSATFLNSDRSTDLVCLTQYSAPALPCGYGPGNSVHFHSQLYALSDDALLGATHLQTSLFSMSSGSDYNALNRTVGVSSNNGASVIASPSPLAYSSLARVRGFSANALLPGKERHAFSVEAYVTQSTQSTTPLVASASDFYKGTSASHYGVIQLTDTVRSSSRFTLVGSAGVSTTTAGFGTIASAAATWRPTSADAYGVSFAMTGAGATGPQMMTLTAPASLNFDCNGNVAYGMAPGGSPGRTSSTSARVNYTRSLGRGNVSLSLYHQVQNGATVPSLVNGTSVESLLPTGYMQQVEQLYESPGGCNAKRGGSFGVQQLYFMMPVTSNRVIYEGGSISGTLSYGNMVIQPYYDINIAKAGWNQYFENPHSITIVGEQIPGIPIQRGGLVLDYKSPSSIFEWLADAQYVGQNNPNHLPSYVTFDAGTTVQLRIGTLTVAVSNITNRYAGVFASSTNAVPYRTVAGDLVGTTAQPLTPRTLSVTYSVRAGVVAGPTQATGAAAESTMPVSPPFGGPGQAGAPIPGGPPFAPPGSSAQVAAAALPSTPPAQPFAVSDNAQSCGRQDQTTAQHLALELKAATARIEHAKSTAGYPAVVTLPASDAATLTYHGLGTTYALSVTPPLALLRPIIRCFTVHITQSDDVRQRQLYTPATTVFATPQLQFMPAVGLYIVPPAIRAGSEQFRLYRLPSQAPSTPFALRVTADCTSDARAVVTQTLGTLESYFARGTLPPGWTVTTHQATSGIWYELRPGDPTVIPAILRCARVATASQSQLKARGFDAAALPALNFAPQLGLYIEPPSTP
jgi:hypothetical protein